jgi:acyl dehydratase
VAIRARLVTAQGDPEIGAERIAIYHEDGHTEEVALHDYARVYALPGVYEQIVQEDLGCRSPAVVAEMLGAVLDDLGRARASARVIDIAAGNGVSGEALAAAGIMAVLGTDIVPEARAAAQRDRPGAYGEYLTLDLTALTDAQIAQVRELRADALTCVSPVGNGGGQVPPAALTAAAALLTDDALVVHLHDPRGGAVDVIDEAFWPARLGPATSAMCVAHRRYLHRFLVNGNPYELEAAVWRVRRARRVGSRLSRTPMQPDRRPRGDAVRPAVDRGVVGSIFATVAVVNPDAVGKRYPPTTYAVGREKIVEYAAAVGERNPLHLDLAAARTAGHPDLVAPPMFVVVYQGGAVGVPMFDPEVGIDFARLLHAGQEFRWGPLVVAGDELTTTVSVQSISERAGLAFYAFAADSVNQRGETVATGLWRNVVRPAEGGG